jgi:hypothetical protein
MRCGGRLCLARVGVWDKAFEIENLARLAPINAALMGFHIDNPLR